MITRISEQVFEDFSGIILPNGNKAGTEEPYRYRNAECRCGRCGKTFQSRLPANDDTAAKTPFSEDLYQMMYIGIDNAFCENCVAIVKSYDHNQEMEKKRLKETLEERFSAAGFPPELNYRNESISRWLAQNINRHVILGGESGCGKTSGVCRAFRWFMGENDANVRYTTRNAIVNEYNKSKVSDDKTSFFWRKIGHLEYLIIDEMAGKRGEEKLSASGQELFFDLIDGAYSKTRLTKIWLIGNFYDGCFAKMFDDFEPTKRRLNQAFAAGYCNGSIVRNSEVN